MKKYKVDVVGTKYVTTESKEQAVEYAQQMLDTIHYSLNTKVFSISEVKETE